MTSSGRKEYIAVEVVWRDRQTLLSKSLGIAPPLPCLVTFGALEGRKGG